MIYLLRLKALLQSIYSIFRPWINTANENIKLRQELVTLKQQQYNNQRVSLFNRFLNWLLVHLSPAILTKLHKILGKLYWKHISNPNKVNGRPIIDALVRQAIKQMAHDNPTWGAPRIHGELQKLGFLVSERSVSRYLKRLKPPGIHGGTPGWLTFRRNHSSKIAAMGFGVVQTLFFKPLYLFFIIKHERRELIHFGVTFHPTALWVSHQIKAAFELGRYDNIKYMIHDRDSIFSSLVVRTLQSLGIKSMRTDFQSPWQNGIAERWVGSCRRELLDHVIIINQRHLYRLLGEYVEYYNEDRTHYSLGKDPPISRPVQEQESDQEKLVAIPRIGGLHHKYVWEKAA